MSFRRADADSRRRRAGKYYGSGSMELDATKGAPASWVTRDSLRKSETPFLNAPLVVVYMTGLWPSRTQGKDFLPTELLSFSPPFKRRCLPRSLGPQLHREAPIPARQATGGILHANSLKPSTIRSAGPAFMLRRTLLQVRQTGHMAQRKRSWGRSGYTALRRAAEPCRPFCRGGPGCSGRYRCGSRISGQGGIPGRNDGGSDGKTVPSPPYVPADASDFLSAGSGIPGGLCVFPCVWACSPVRPERDITLIRISMPICRSSFLPPWQTPLPLLDPVPYPAVWRL